MKTLTEFAAPVLKNAALKHAELTAAGKTAEELPAAMGEALKLEGDKLTHLLGALEALGTKTHELKRVVVSTLNEGETAPSTAKLVGEKYYTPEYYMPMVRNEAPTRDAKGGRDGKRGGRDGKGRGGPGGDRGGKPGGPGRGPGGDRGAPRGPRPEGASASPSGGKPNVKPNVTPVTQAASKDSAPTS
jgi:hypothetical protein